MWSSGGPVGAGGSAGGEGDSGTSERAPAQQPTADSYHQRTAQGAATRTSRRVRQ